MVAIAALAIAIVRTAWMCDDAFITMRTVDNLLHGHGLRWNAAERVQSFTHPLWLFVLAVPYAVTREPFYTCVIPAILFSLCAAWILLTHARRSGPSALAMAGVALLCSRATIEYSTSGLENPLTHLLLVAFLAVLAGESPPDDRRLLLAGGIAGLATLNRIDTFLLVAPMLVAAGVARGSRRGWMLLAAGFAPLVLWEAFSAFYYGSLIPNSARAKLATGIGAAASMRQGWFYLVNAVRNDPATPLVIACALLASAASVARRPGKPSRAIVVPAACGILFYLAYVVRIGGDFMSGRFLTAPFVASVFVLATLEPFPGRSRGRIALTTAVAIAGLAFTARPALLSGSDFGRDMTGLVDRHGIADERRYYFGTSGILNGQPAGARPVGAELAIAGLDLRRGGTPLAVESVVGMCGYYAGPQVHVLDTHGIGDPLLARLPAVAIDRQYAEWMTQVNPGLAPEDAAVRVGHYTRNVPPGYLATLLTGVNRIVEPRVAAFYDRLRLVTRGPLWGAGRMRAAIAMSLGSGRGLARTRPDYDVTPDWTEVIAVRPDLAEPHYRRALEAFDDNRFPDALAATDAAIGADADHARAWMLRGTILAAQGERRGAEDAWRRAEEIRGRLARVGSRGGAR